MASSKDRWWNWAPPVLAAVALFAFVLVGAGLASSGAALSNLHIRLPHLAGAIVSVAGVGWDAWGR